MNQPEEQVNLNIFEHIDAICKQFRRAWRKGERPRIEDWLNKVNDQARTTLFSSLLDIELNYRRQSSESPDAKEYLKRFPKFASQIRQAFDESTMGSLESPAAGAGWTRSSDDLSSDRDRDQLTFDIPAANRLGDYELLRELGRGGFGVVYEARHLQRGNRVALKTLPTGGDGQQVNADRLHKFRKEFRSLSEINHPNLVGMQTLEVDGDQWFFTMDLIEGEDFLSHVRPMEQLDEERLRSALKQLAGGIIFLHERGIVHRDLKPSNVLVDESGRVVILDFGLVAELQTQSELTVSRSGMFAGTPRYAAPEQMFGERSEASDWYAFGTMLFEALTGQPPFIGKQMEVLRQKQSDDPPRLVEQEQTEVTEDLAILADGLLKREPSERFNTRQIVDALQLDLKTRSYGSTAGSHGSTGSVDEEQLDPLAPFDEEIVLIGREKQLAQLEAARKELLEHREPVFVWITGKSGEGKSSLAEKFLQPIRNGTDMLVLSGRCYDRESVPFKAIDSIIDSLVRFLNSHHGKPHQSSLPEDFAFLARLFPLLNRVKAIGKAKTPHVAPMDSEKIRARGFYALRELLTTISLRTPVVVSIDDLQWADADSAQAWVEVLTGVDAPALLFLGSYRSDEVAESPFLQTWNRLACGESRRLDSLEIGVEPLSRAQCIELAAIRTGAASRMIHQQADELFEDTGGNPYFLEQLIEGFDAETVL